MTNTHCPGFDAGKKLRSYMCKCPCGAEIEIFSDEIDRKHTCKTCGKLIDSTQCRLDAGI